MKCPKCNHENDPDAQICSACGSDLLQASAPPRRPDVKISELAVSSCLLAVLAVVLFFLFTFFVGPSFFGLCSVVLGILALILGIASLVCIEKSYGRLTGRAFAVIGIAIPVAIFFLIIAKSGLSRRRSTAYRLHCGTNLSRIGKAMFIYANDYDDQFPHAGGPNSKWGPTSDFQAATAAEAYGLNDGPGQASISANFYLLVKFAEVAPKSFLCIRDEGVSKFTLAEYEIRNKDLADLWDFGPDPSKHCSYTYHIPYGPYPLTTSSNPGLAVAADRNPWLDTPGRRARPVTDWTSFDPNGDRGSVKQGNAITHQNDGQNVLFADDHTNFEKTSACGINEDNIYTSQNGTDITKGALPTTTSQPANKTDSLLLHDPPKGAKK